MLILQLIAYHQCILHSYPHDEAKRSPQLKNQVLEKRQEGSLDFDFDPIIGAQSVGGQCYPRQNVEVLQTQFPDQFNILILAFDDLQRNPGTNGNLSWFGIAGIHGQPHIAWEQPDSEGPFNTNLGYCVHSSPLFTFWHRPYVLLMEQVLHERAVAIADRFTDDNRDRYVTAADRLRLPYIDWSAIAYGRKLPSFVSSARINVITPSADGSSQSATINNPFYRYYFTSQQLSQLSYPYSVWQYTTRNPSGVSPAPSNNDASVDRSMDATFTTRRQTTYNLFSWTNFNSFSSQCEGIHNSIHRIIGGSGHMSSTGAAAYDPVFWFHHSNIDRLLALYQAIHPSNLLTDATAVATYGRTIPGKDGSLDTLNTRLYPFRRTDGTMYTSMDFVSGTTGIWKYGYGYPEIPCGGSLTASQLSSNVRAAVNSLYGPEGASSKRRRATESLPKAPSEPHPKQQCRCHPPESESGLIRTEYNLRLFIDHSEIPGLWTCHIFLGTVPGNTSDYSTSPNRCGVFASFGAWGEHKVSMPYAYDLAITDKLLELDVPLTETAVSEYLTQNLKFIITSETGDSIDPARLKTFQAGVCTSVGKYGKYGSDKLASFGDCKALWKITEKIPGGITCESQLNKPTLLDGTSQNLGEKLQTY